MSRRLAVGRLDLYRHRCLLAYLIGLPIGAYLHVQLVLLVRHTDFSKTESKRRFGQVDKRRGCNVVFTRIRERAVPGLGLLPTPGKERIPRHFAQAAAQSQHRSEEHTSELQSIMRIS